MTETKNKILRLESLDDLDKLNPGDMIIYGKNKRKGIEIFFEFDQGKDHHNLQLISRVTGSYIIINKILSKRNLMINDEGGIYQIRKPKTIFYYPDGTIGYDKRNKTLESLGL